MTRTDEPTTRDAAGPSVYLETFGCQMNVLDSQLVCDQLRGLGYRFVDDWKQADVVLYNTCSVRERAEQKVWSRVGEIGVYKEQRPDLVLGVIGCMAEREGANMASRHPQVDLLCGPGELDKVPGLIDNVLRTDLHFRGGRRNAQVALQGNTHRRSGTLSAAEDQLELIDLSRSFSPNAHGGSAYVRITRGCNKFCTYCVVPNTRGAEVHRPPEHILEECRRLVASGVKEITLLGQTVNHYHYDHTAAKTVNGVKQPQVGAIVKNKGTSFDANGLQAEPGDHNVTTFAQLLAMIHDEIPELARLRFVTSFPRDFGDDILHTIADRPRICQYLHLPVQSGSNRMLKLMNRGYTVEQYIEFVDRVKTILPAAQIATDIICGFPTETEEDHQQTAELLRHCRFKNSFIFKYSPRPDTVAQRKFDDDVPTEVKKRRNNELLAIQSEVSTQIHQSYVGREVPVFVESISSKERKARYRQPDHSTPGSVELRWETRQQPQDGGVALAEPVSEPAVQLTGRTGGDLIVCFDGDESQVGQIVNVKITSAAPLTLFGELSEPSG